MRLLLDKSSTNRLEAALDILRIAGIEPHGGARLGDLGAVLISDVDAGEALAILRRFGFEAHGDHRTLR